MAARVMHVVLRALVVLTFINFAHAGENRAGNTKAGQTSVTQNPPKWHKPAVPQRADGGFWRVDHTFKAQLTLFNIVQVATVTVTPVLYMADGTRYELSSVILPPAGVAAVDINNALRNAPTEIQPHLSEFGSASIEFKWPWAAAVSAKVENLDVSRSLVHHFPLHWPVAPSSNAAAATSKHANKAASGNLTAASSNQPEFTVKEGLWWKHDDDVGGFLAITNTSKVETQVHLSTFGGGLLLIQNGLSDGSESVRDLVIVPGSTQMVDLKPIPGAGHDASRAGGIRVRYKGSPSDISISGGLENPRIGYSATIPFLVAPDTPSSDKFEGALVGMMVGAPDPMMMFPKETSFQPYMALRNISSAPATVSVTAFYALGGETASARLPEVTLQPNEAQQVDLNASLNSAGLGTYSGMVTFTLSSNAPADGLLVAGGSVDQTGSYVFEVACTGVGASEAKLLGAWNLANGNDTMISLWNANDSDQDARVLLFFEGGQYSYPIHLTKHGTTMFNVSDIVRAQQPDANGNVIPASILHGSAVLSGAKDQTDSIDIGVSVGTFNVETATCGGTCPNCVGYVDFWIEYDGVSMLVNSSFQNYVFGETETGYQLDYTTEAAWGSSGVVSVGNGLYSSGTSGGSFTVSATQYLNLPSDQCGDPRTHCPADYFEGDASGFVSDPTPYINSISPANLNAGQTTTVDIYGGNFGTQPQANVSGSYIDGQPTVIYADNGHIRVNVTIDANAPSESITFSVQSNGYNSLGWMSNGSTSSNSNSAQASVTPIAAPVPLIKFNGVDVTNQHVSAVVIGQQIPLTTEVDSQLAVQSSSWTIPGNYVGGYDTTNGGIVTVNLTSTGVAFYWAAQGSGYQVQYYYCFANQECNSSTVTFDNVTGPSSIMASGAAQSYPQIYNDGGATCFGVTFGLYLGDCPGDAVAPPGMQFTLSSLANPAGVSGATYQWVQLVTGGTVKYINNGNLVGPPCSITPGLDKGNVGYPYAQSSSTPFSTPDSPLVPMHGTINEVNLTESFRMFLMWEPNIQNTTTIPVPLGYIDWSWSADAQLSNGTWSIPSGQGNGGPNNNPSFTVPPSVTFPLWSSVASGC